MSNDTTNVSSDNITMKTLNQKENTKEQQGVTALIAIMEPATESQAFRAYKQPLKGCPSNKLKVLQWRSFSYWKKKTNYFIPDMAGDKVFAYLKWELPDPSKTGNLLKTSSFSE